eukprot:15432827-Alexandrium_andersonii.AAC.1
MGTPRAWAARGAAVVAGRCARLHQRAGCRLLPPGRRGCPEACPHRRGRGGPHQALPVVPG